MTHPGEMRFSYRHKTPENLSKLKGLRLDHYLEYQNNRWTCTSCGGRVHFYHDAWGQCGKGVMV
jgi:hypothetical protein